MDKERIHRVRKDNNFVMLDKGFLNNSNLSLKAKGLLAYVLSLPDDWVIYTEEIAKHHKDGKAAVLTAFKELESEGHVKRERVRQANGQLQGYKTTVYETPVTENRLSEVGKTEVGKTEVGKSSTTKNYSTKNDFTKNNSTKSKDSLMETVVAHYQSNYGNMPPLVITAVDKFLKKGFEAEVITKAIDLALEKGKKWDYAAGILQRLDEEHKVKTLVGYEKLVEQKKRRTNGRQSVPDHKVPEWLEEEGAKQREHDKRRQEELAASVPDDHELEEMLAKMRGGA
ncbi:helix-turn-helix domain-containing protein [Exiguobacterium sp. s21]|uniref:helix-turn-helix domain-containing protein n=1 Tax=Exiguobacterium sp. s21 TaxID=2751244 RepID=UPI001BE8CDDA|nr:helix-turn-helix domain-containing protein [Exiguobacterium sp. s21]